MSMETILRRAAGAQLTEIQQLLRESGLPLGGVEEHLQDFIVAIDGEKLVGTAGLEIYGNAALLRSVAVRKNRRGTGIGQRLVAEVLSGAQAAGVQSVSLLTTTASEYFARLGFKAIQREDIDPRLLASREFSEPSCATAVFMTVDLAELPEQSIKERSIR